LSSLKRKTRAHVRKGLKACECHEIGFDLLARDGLLLNRETMDRQARNDPMFGDEKRWRRLIDAGRAVSGAQAWGALVDGVLAAYLIAFRTDDVVSILYGMCRSDMLKYRPNHALVFSFITTSLSHPDVRRISGGPASIFELPQLDQYKVSMGFRKEPAELAVVFNPWLGPIALSRLAHATLGAAQRLRPKSDTLKRTAAILRIARASRPWSKQQTYA
jgi:hypothetical protein